MEVPPRAEPMHAEPIAHAGPSMTAEAPPEPEPVVAPEPEPVRPQADGHRRDWLGDARRLTHSGDGGDGRGPGRGRTTRGRRGPGRLIALGVLALILLGIGWFLVSLFQPFKGDGDGATVRVTIPQGSSLSQIADRLERSGVVDDAGFFQLRARLTGHSGDLRPGSYELRKDMSFAAALDALQEGVPPNVVQVSIPEGLSRKEIAPLTDGLRGSYVRATRRSPSLNPRDYGARGATSLEGFLFPATYELKKGQTVRRLRDQQLAQFKTQLRQGRPELRQAQEPDALRRADHRVAGGARGDARARSGRSSPRSSTTACTTTSGSTSTPPRASPSATGSAR